MNLLDYWCGERKHVLDYWREDYGIAALKKYVSTEVNNLTVHALDPVHFTERRSSERHNGIDFEFYTHFPDLPTGIDIVCALHPNPGVLSDRGWWSDEEDFHMGRYLGFLSEVIGNHTKIWAFVALQFDDEIKQASYWTWENTFIERLRSYGKYWDYRLEPVEPLSPGPRFPSWIYTFSSFHLFKKVEITAK